jgi:hypothetical protein
MKLALLIPVLTAVGRVLGDTPVTTENFSLITVAPLTASTTTADAEPVVLAKRARKAIINPKYREVEDRKAALAKNKGKGTLTEPPAPWRRTIYGLVVEIVTPTVIAGVTFGAKPPKTTDGLEYWVSLKKDGSPKTIKPENKGGRIKNPSPTYGTYFATATTVQYTKEQIKAHNMADDEIHVETEYIEEDDTYQKLSPLIRCTPDRYFKKGTAKQTRSDPFCTPHDNQRWMMDKTYFVTWYSQFFEGDVDKVRVHLSLIKESAKLKGFKRSLTNETESYEEGTNSTNKRSEAIEAGGTISKQSFYVSDWLDNSQGYFPVTVLEEWIGENEFTKKISISIQPDNVSDEDFDVLDRYVVVEIAKKTIVTKGTHLDLKKLEEKQRQESLGYEVETGVDLEKYYIMMAMPMCVTIAALGMYLFVRFNKTDLSNLKKKRAAGKNTTHRKIPWKSKAARRGYDTLPLHSKDLELENVGKKD